MPPHGRTAVPWLRSRCPPSHRSSPFTSSNSDYRQLKVAVAAPLKGSLCCCDKEEIRTKSIFFLVDDQGNGDLTLNMTQQQRCSLKRCVRASPHCLRALTCAPLGPAKQTLRHPSECICKNCVRCKATHSNPCWWPGSLKGSLGVV